MKFIVLDGYSINPGDLSWAPLEGLCDFHSFDRTSESDIIERIVGSDGFFVSKCRITREIMKSCPNLKFIGITATGTDNVDIEAARELGIAVCNVPAYSTDAVAQHVFAMLLELTNSVGMYDSAVQRGKWYDSKDFTFIEKPLTLLSGKSLGIIGYGNIGKKVASIGEALGMKINVYSKDKGAVMNSDVITLHCPATPENFEFVNRDFIRQMKDQSILINTARGALINEADLANALKSGKLAAAAVDVLQTEPPHRSNPLIGLPNCILTPHIAWMPKETRQLVIDICAENLTAFLAGKTVNRVD